jgi:hypothetical protein
VARPVGAVGWGTYLFVVGSVDLVSREEVIELETHGALPQMIRMGNGLGLTARPPRRGSASGNVPSGLLGQGKSRLTCCRKTDDNRKPRGDGNPIDLSSKIGYDGHAGR